MFQMGYLHPSFESVLYRVIAAEKRSGCDLRQFMFTQLGDILLMDQPFLESFQEQLVQTEDYEWCASVQQLMNKRPGFPKVA